jgi:hypothetical protein
MKNCKKLTKQQLLDNVYYLFNLAYESGITNGDKEARDKINEACDTIGNFIKANYK